jgi:gliding motility-associated-like protein
MPIVESVSVQASDCGTDNGSVTFNYANGTTTPVTFALQGAVFQSSNVFSSLATGNYNFILQDGNGCLSEDTLVFVPAANNTIASFTVSPDYGIAPLTIELTNASQYATDFLWSVNGISEGSTLSSFICDTSGTYTIELIAWQYDPNCADTVYQTIIVIDKLIIPTAFTPDNDGVNDYWELPNIDEIYPENVVSVYNRWGELLFQSEAGTYSTHPWKGRYNDEPLPVGSYYYIIETHDQVGETFNGIVSIIR